MIKHIVMFQRKAGVAFQAGLEQGLIERMRGLNKQVDCIREWRLQANEVDRPISWHYVLESSFDNVDALNEYLFHPVHQALIADLKPYFEGGAVDYTA